MEGREDARADRPREALILDQDSGDFRFLLSLRCQVLFKSAFVLRVTAVTAHVCVHLCLSVCLHQHTNMCVDPARRVHPGTHECVFTCVTEHLVGVSSKLMWGEENRHSSFLCGPRGPVRFHASGGVCVCSAHVSYDRVHLHTFQCPPIVMRSPEGVSLAPHHTALPWIRGLGP